MILVKQCGGYRVYIKENEAIYENILKDYLNNCLNILQVFKDTKESKVLLVDSGGGNLNKKYIVKIFSPQNNKMERFIKSFFKGDYYLNLLRETQRVYSEGFTSINDFYLLAERKFFVTLVFL